MMHIKIGDLVKCRDINQQIGIVIDKRISNEGLVSSMHVRHMINNCYPQVYYVYFSDGEKAGPFHEADLFLQQSL